MNIRRIAVVSLLAALPLVAAAPALAAAAAAHPPATGEVGFWLVVDAKQMAKLAAKAHLDVTGVAAQAQCAVSKAGKWACRAGQADGGRRFLRCVRKVQYEIVAGRRVHERAVAACGTGTGHAGPPVTGTPFAALAVFLPRHLFHGVSSIPDPNRAAASFHCLPTARHGHSYYSCAYLVSAAHIAGSNTETEKCAQAGIVRWVGGKPVVRYGKGFCEGSASAGGSGSPAS